jgi:putative addiction module component (TIGR02574 family)
LNPIRRAVECSNPEDQRGIQMDFSSTLAAVNSLSVDQRIQLLEAVWDGIAAEQPIPNLTEAQKQELERRVAAYRAAPNEVSTWDEVKARALSGRRPQP